MPHVLLTSLTVAMPLSTSRIASSGSADCCACSLLLVRHLLVYFCCSSCANLRSKHWYASSKNPLHCLIIRSISVQGSGSGNSRHRSFLRIEGMGLTRVRFPVSATDCRPTALSSMLATAAHSCRTLPMTTQVAMKCTPTRMHQNFRKRGRPPGLIASAWTPILETM